MSDGQVVRVGFGVDFVDLERVLVVLHAAVAGECGRAECEGPGAVDGRAGVGGGTGDFVRGDGEADLVDDALDELVEGLELAHDNGLLGGRGGAGLRGRGSDGGAEEGDCGGEVEAHLEVNW